MRMFVVVAFLLCVLSSVDVGAQTIKDGLSGTIVSASVAVAQGSTATIYAVPASGHFVLTEIGSASGLEGETCGPLLFSVTGFGPISEVAPTTAVASFAHQFAPGLALPQGALVQCNYEGSGCLAASDCYMTGV